MTIEKAIHIMIENYELAKNNKAIRKPISFALFRAWQYTEAHEKEISMEEIYESMPKKTSWEDIKAGKPLPPIY